MVALVLGVLGAAVFPSVSTTSISSGCGFPGHKLLEASLKVGCADVQGGTDVQGGADVQDGAEVCGSDVIGVGNVRGLGVSLDLRSGLLDM